MTAIERLADLRANLDHLTALLAARKVDEAALRSDRSLHNDVLFSLLMICQAVIDVAGDIAGRRGIRFNDYTEAVRALEQVDGFSPDLVRALERLPGFRNILVHEYTDLDYARVLEALEGLAATHEFMRVAAGVLEESR